MTDPRITARREGDSLVIRDTTRPNVKQQRFYRECDRQENAEVLLHGAIGTGKTQAACKKIVEWAMRYGGTHMVSRLSYRELEDSTKKAMLYGDGNMPPALPPQLVANRSETHNKVTLVNGAEILFRSLEPDQRGKIRNITLASIFIDQAEELEDEEIDEFYLELLGRLRDPRGPRKIILIANPGPTDHWLYQRFVDFAGKVPGTAEIHVTLLDNAENLPKDYVRRLLATEHTQPDFFARMVMGEWGAFGGRRFKIFDRKLHVVEQVFDIPEGWVKLEGIDYGWKNPTVCEWAAIDYYGRWWIVAEHYASETRVSKHAERMKQIRSADPEAESARPFRGSLEPSASWLDPSAWARKGEYESAAIQFLENGIFASKAINERIGGWGRIEEYLGERMADGLPRLRIFPTCKLLIKELPNLRIKPGTDDVDKVNDHAADALRYVVMSHMPGPEDKTPQEQHTREAVMKRAIDRAHARREGVDNLVVG